MLTWLVPHETAAVLACSVYTIQPCCFMQSDIRKVHLHLAVTCHTHFWQNDQDLLHATVATWRWKRYQNKSAQKVDLWGEENVPATPTGTQTHNLLITSPAL